MNDEAKIESPGIHADILDLESYAATTGLTPTVCYVLTGIRIPRGLYVGGFRFDPATGQVQWSQNTTDGHAIALSAPSEPVPDGPRVWAAVPTFPDDVKAFRDAEGRVWRRDQTKPGWRRDTGAWTQKDPLELLRYHPRLSPLTEVVEEATP